MLSSRTGILIAACSALVLPAYSQVNIGFETGDLTGWDVYTGISGIAQVVTSAANDPSASTAMTYTAPAGNDFADLWAGAGANVYTTISQTFNMTAGETLQGWSAFIAHDYIPWNDSALATITVSGPGTTLFYSDVNTVGSYNSTPWTAWTYTAASAGSYTLTYGVENYGDNNLPSEALFDTTAVPEPTTMVAGMLLLLPVGMSTLRILRKKQAA